jgi:mono/diheme cytochrome c family protein
MNAKRFCSEPGSLVLRGLRPLFGAVGVAPLPLRAAQLIMLAVAAPACNTLDEPGPKGSVVVIPTDTRPPALTGEPPAPISGGTLAVSADGAFAVAADPDRDRVSVVALNTNTPEVEHVALNKGDQPGRVQLDDMGRAYVVLRRSGELAVIDLAKRALEQRIAVCAAPRGVAFAAAERLVHVACADGRLVSLLQAPGAASLRVVRDLRVEEDLRDVLVRGDQLWVSTFKRAELLNLDPNGHVLQRTAAQSFDAISFGAAATGGATSATMQSHLAYRSVLDPSGGVLMLHQGASTAEIAIGQDPQTNAPAPYGSTSGCDGIVGPALTSVSAAGKVQTIPVASGLLSVDMAIAPDDGSIAIVQAGALDTDAPQRQTFFDSEGSSSAPVAQFGRVPGLGVVAASGSVDTGGRSTQLTLVDPKDTGTSCLPGRTLTVPGQSTAVAFRRATSAQPLASSTDTGSWVVQSRESALLTVVRRASVGGGAEATVISLGGDSVRDTGHDIFHQDAGGGIACASCHPEGAEDGHVWHFSQLGSRRTQALHIGLDGTAPFHWGGDQPDIAHLMTDVFIGRMGGVYQSNERLSALTRFLFSLQPPAAPVVTDEAAVERGRQLFQSADVGCGTCHSGEKLTNNRSVDVGTGGVLQVPSLRGIVYRAPFMHNGCALTLRSRFDASCGGSAHGKTAGLAPDAIDDLVAYLRTL